MTEPIPVPVPKPQGEDITNFAESLMNAYRQAQQLPAVPFSWLDGEMAGAWLATANEALKLAPGVKP